MGTKKRANLPNDDKGIAVDEPHPRSVGRVVGLGQHKGDGKGRSGWAEEAIHPLD